MRNVLKKIFDLALIGFLLFVIVISTSIYLYSHGYLYSLSDIKLDKTKLDTLNRQIEIFDNKNEIIDSKEYSNKNINIEEIPNYVIDAFVSIEDKNFYKHKGINYKRLTKALLKNMITSRKMC